MSETKGKAKFNIRTYTMIIALAILFVLFTAMTKGAFITTRNLSNLTRQMAITGVLATGMAVVIISGNIDLSVGMLLGFVGGVGSALMVWSGWGVIPTLLVQAVIGIFIGLFQGSVVAYLAMPAFITTLGMQLILRGGTLGVIKGSTVAPLHESYVMIGQSYLTTIVGNVLAAIAVVVFALMVWNKRRSNLKYNFPVKPLWQDVVKIIIAAVLIIGFVAIMNDYQGIPFPVLLMLALSLILTFLAEKTTFGRSVYAIGGNREAAKYAGINTKRVTVMVFVICGLLASVAGVMMSARLNAGTPQAGQYMETDAIASAVIGGMSMSGGTGRVMGALLGAAIMATLDNGMSMMNVETFWQYIVKGAVMIVAVWFDISTKKKGVAA